jgi:hypothetical protein
LGKQSARHEQIVSRDRIISVKAALGLNKKELKVQIKAAEFRQNLVNHLDRMIEKRIPKHIP